MPHISARRRHVGYPSSDRARERLRRRAKNRQLRARAGGPPSLPGERAAEARRREQDPALQHRGRPQAHAHCSLRQLHRLPCRPRLRAGPRLRAQQGLHRRRHSARYSAPPHAPTARPELFPASSSPAAPPQGVHREHPQRAELLQEAQRQAQETALRVQDRAQLRQHLQRAAARHARAQTAHVRRHRLPAAVNAADAARIRSTAGPRSQASSRR